MRNRRRNGAGVNLLGLAWDAGMLALEAQQVIGLRMAKLLRGGAAATREAASMVAEKVAVAGVTGVKLATGSSGRSVIRHYRRKVRANRRRLAKER
jgi:hypothetical protein